MTSRQTLLRRIPAVDRVLQSEPMRELLGQWPQERLTEAAQAAVAGLRARLLAAAGEETAPDLSPEALGQVAARALRAQLAPSLRPVINATGTVLHTNLGRAPLCPQALAAVEQVARGYANLELDLPSGERGHRYEHVEALLCRLTGAEAALAVNNNAAAVMLALAALAGGREAIVSRGELVEIGGSFRIPEVMEHSGVHLREVGSTNKTHRRDYARAIGPETALLLKVHTSNYRIVGFTASVPAAELVALGRERSVAVMEDLGSGMLLDLTPFGLPREPTVAEAVAAGVDVVTFSGDKLLGGPQAGLLVGRKEALERIRRHPIARAVRSDKLTLAALEATLRLYLQPERALREIPVLHMLALTADELERRGHALAQRLRDAVADAAALRVVAEPGTVGGGALPTVELPGFAVALSPLALGVDELARRLRTGAAPVVGRIQDDALLLNPRTIAPAEEARLIAAVRAALHPEG